MITKQEFTRRLWEIQKRRKDQRNRLRILEERRRETMVSSYIAGERDMRTKRRAK